MKKLLPNTEANGFSAILPVIIIVVLVIVGVSGYLIMRHMNQTKSTKSTTSAKQSATPPATSTTATTQTSSTAGWQTFCSKYGGLCLKYPSNWKLKTKAIPAIPTGSQPPAPGAKIPSATQADITSPSGNVTVQYIPSCVPMSQPPAGTYTDDVLSITPPSATPELRVVKTVEHMQYSGNNIVSDNFYITTGANVTKFAILAGTHTLKEDNEAIAGYFVNPKNQHNGNLQCINVGSKQNANGGNYATFSSISAGNAWFSNSEVKTADQILNSISYN